MLSVLNKSLIIVLAMLQFFAPLVHAHTGNQDFNQGLHIPGLESYHSQHATVAKNVNDDRYSEGLLVVVDAGIKNPQNTWIDNDDDNFAILPVDQLQIIRLFEIDHNFSPQIRAAILPNIPAAYSSRAPPSQ